MASFPKGNNETSPLLRNDRDNEAHAKPLEDEKNTTITWSITAGIVFTWVASFLAAMGR
jgi:hypothetical protein